jgi:hypothetical protein
MRRAARHCPQVHLQASSPADGFAVNGSVSSITTTITITTTISRVRLVVFA